MGSYYGENIRVQIFGQSHSAAIGVTIDGLPAGIELDLDELQQFLERRAPGRSSLSTARREPDRFKLLSGVVGNRLCGAPLTAIIENMDQHSQDYSQIKDLPRPGHADYPAAVKFHGACDYAGGGHFSGRLTAPLCIAGGICLQLLRREGIEIAAHIVAIGKVADRNFTGKDLTESSFNKLHQASLPVLDRQAGLLMQEEILSAAKDGDSVGGIIECAAIGLPVGLGSPMFGGLENRLSAAVFAVPAVKGIEFGAGFACARMRGSEHNDSYVIDGLTNEIKTVTNNHGGILGGLSSGMPLVFRVAVKPTPSIFIEQQTVNLSLHEPALLQLKGRHDPCIVPRAMVGVEAAAAIALYDCLSSER